MAALYVAVGTLLFVGGIWTVFRGYYGAGDAIDILLDTGRGWPRVLGWGFVAFGGAGMSAGVVTYGLSVCTVC